MAVSLYQNTQSKHQQAVQRLAEVRAEEAAHPIDFETATPEEVEAYNLWNKGWIPRLREAERVERATRTPAGAIPASGGMAAAARGRLQAARERRAQTGESIKTAMRNQAVEAEVERGAGKPIESFNPQERQAFNQAQRQGLGVREAAEVAVLERNQSEAYRIARAKQLSHQQALELVRGAGALTGVELESFRRKVELSEPVERSFRETTEMVTIDAGEGAKYKVSQAQLDRLLSLKGQRQERYARELGLGAEVIDRLAQPVELPPDTITVPSGTGEAVLVSRTYVENLKRDYPGYYTYLQDDRLGLKALNDAIDRDNAKIATRRAALDTLAAAGYSSATQAGRLSPDALPQFKYDIAGYLAAGGDKKTLEAAGFTRSQVDKAAKDARALQAADLQLRLNPPKPLLPSPYKGMSVEEYNALVAAERDRLVNKAGVSEAEAEHKSVSNVRMAVKYQNSHELKPQAERQQELKEYRDRLQAFRDSPAEQARRRQELRGMPMQAAEYLIPGVATARNWDKMDVPQRALSIGLDAATLALIILGPKAVGGIGRRLSGATRAVSLAEKAGVAGRQLQREQAILEKALTTKRPALYSGEMTGEINRMRVVAYHAARAQQAVEASMRADRLFLEQLERVRFVSPAELAKLEKLSGIRNLKAAVINVNRETMALNKAWQRLDEVSDKGLLSKYTKEKTWGQRALMDEREYYKYVSDINEYQQRIADVRLQQARLSKALEDAGSVLKPRYSYPEAAPEYKGVRVSLKKDAQSAQARREIDRELQEWFRRLNEPQVPKGGVPQPGKKLAVAVEERIEVKPRQLKLVREKVYVKPKAATETARAIPKVAAKRSVFPGIVRAKPETVEYAPGREGAGERLGAMTPEQAERLSEKTGGQAAVRSRRIGEEEAAGEERSSEVARPQPETVTLIDEETGQVVRLVEVTGEAEREASKPAGEPAPAPAPRPAPERGLVTETPTKAPPKTPPEIPGKPPYSPPGQRGALLPPRKTQQTDEEKRAKLAKVQSFTAHRRGELNGEDLWLIAYSPWGQRDKMTLLGKAPAGAKVVRGKGSVQGSLTLLKGKPPPPGVDVYWDTGAVDDVVSTSASGQLTVRSVQDKETKQRQRVRTPRMGDAVSLGGGIEINKKGRGHLAS